MLAVINYNAGNTRSVMNALHRMNVEAVVTDDPEIIRSADKVFFPGVGEASTAMRYLKEANLIDVIRDLHQPFLGVCLGLQLMCKHSEEGDTPCLGIFDHEVRKFPEGNEAVPHMGWNTLENTKSPLFEGLKADDDVYFVHSYCADIGSCTTAETNYIKPFSAALAKDNFHAVQFHPEKSAWVGEKILRNFLSL